jgi:UDP-glucose 6-dehydrogenase
MTCRYLVLLLLIAVADAANPSRGVMGNGAQEAQSLMSTLTSTYKYVSRDVNIPYTVNTDSLASISTLA